MSYSKELITLMDQYKEYNLLLPAVSEVQINPLYKYHVEIVPVDLSPTSGDIYKVGSTQVAGANGKDEYVDVYALSKPLLNKMAMAACIHFNPKNTYGERVDKYTYRAHAEGAIRTPDGMGRPDSDQKEICLLDEEEKFRLEFADKAEKGIEDWRQANAAAQVFKGRWVDVLDRYGKPKVNDKGYKVKKFVIDEEDRQRYIERSVMVNMALLRKTWAEKAMTGAKMRVIRSLLGIKGTYTLAELRKNFAIQSIVFSPDYSDPIVRQTLLAQATGAIGNMFGATAIGQPQRMNFDTEASRYDVDVDVTDSSFISEQNEAMGYAESDPQYITDPEPVAVREAGPVYQETPAPETPRQSAQPQTNNQSARQNAEYTCGDCGKAINKNIYDFSMRVFKRALCMDCQKKERANRR